MSEANSLLDQAGYRAGRKQAVKQIAAASGVSLLMLGLYAVPWVPLLPKWIACVFGFAGCVYGIVQNQAVRRANEALDDDRRIWRQQRQQMTEQAWSVQQQQIVGLPDASLLPDDTEARRLIETLFYLGVQCAHRETLTGPSFIRYNVELSRGVKFNAIYGLPNDLQIGMAAQYAPIVTAQAGYVSIDFLRAEGKRETVWFEDYWHPTPRTTEDPVLIPVGINLTGELVTLDFSDSRSCHMLVAGTTGSGKSEFIRSALLALITSYSPAQLQVAIVDPKWVTFPEFETMPWLWQGRSIVKEEAGAIELMQHLVDEMEIRYRLFNEAKCNDIKSYNSKNPNKRLPRIIAVFDEYADFMAIKAIREKLEEAIKRLGAMARAAGIHLVIGTQRPDAKVITPLIRSNLPTRIALKTVSEADSCIVFGTKNTAASRLAGRGDLLYSCGGARPERLQGLFADSETTERLIEEYSNDIEVLAVEVTDENLPPYIGDLLEISRSKGWISASIAKRSRRSLQKFEPDKIRGFFELLERQGKGSTRGDNRKQIEWCLEPQKWLEAAPSEQPLDGQKEDVD